MQETLVRFELFYIILCCTILMNRIRLKRLLFWQIETDASVEFSL